MKWTTPPTRREMTLILFSLTTFILFYNIEYSFELVGLDRLSQGALTSRLWQSKGGVIGPDGRKPRPWRDELENEIFGNWEWEQGHVAGDGKERQQGKGEDRYGAMWSGITTKDWGEFDEQAIFGATKVQEGMVPWGDSIPHTKLVKHIPGYTILDSVVLLNETLYIITDNPSSFPSLGAIASSFDDPNQPPTADEWRTLSSQQAKEQLGDHVGIIDGVSWLSNDPTPHNHTLVSLWRTYACLDLNISSSGLTTLPAPRRLIFPNIYTFSDPLPEDPFDLHRRVRSHAGFHPLLPKAAFPTLGIMYTQDWEDWTTMGLPFLFHRLVISDRSAAARAQGISGSELTGPFERLDGSRYWWEPVRKTLTGQLGIDTDDRKMVVTYVTRQHEREGPKLKNTDGRALEDALKKLGRDYGCEVYVVADEKDTNWPTVMAAIARSTVVIGVYGPHLTNHVYMKPSPQATLMEIFPRSVFNRDQEIVARALGTRYIAWQSNQKFGGDSLPPVSQVDYTRPQEISIDVPAIISTIRESLQH